MLCPYNANLIKDHVMFNQLNEYRDYLSQMKWQDWVATKTVLKNGITFLEYFKKNRNFLKKDQTHCHTGGKSTRRIILSNFCYFCSYN